MNQVLLLVFSFVLLGIGGYLLKKRNELVVLFSKNNISTLKQLAISFILLGMIGIIIGIFTPTLTLLLTFISLVLVISAVLTIKIANQMT